jgi:hypothetical protein
MSMSEPFLPVSPESADHRAEEEIDDLDNGDSEPDVLPGPADDEEGAATRDAGPFRTPTAGDRLSPAELEAELD